jgi:hypothetical protein
VDPLEDIVLHASRLRRLRPRVRVEEEALHRAIVAAAKDGRSRALIAEAANMTPGRVAQILKREL